MKTDAIAGCVGEEPLVHMVDWAKHTAQGLCAVIGPPGCGKTLLIRTALSEADEGMPTQWEPSGSLRSAKDLASCLSAASGIPTDVLLPERRATVPADADDRPDDGTGWYVALKRRLCCPVPFDAHRYCSEGQLVRVSRHGMPDAVFTATFVEACEQVAVTEVRWANDRRFVLGHVHSKGWTILRHVPSRRQYYEPIGQSGFVHFHHPTALGTAPTSPSGSAADAASAGYATRMLPTCGSLWLWRSPSAAGPCRVAVRKR
eukprot:TRINITY_DN12047_c0_g1_i1.p1 TRINITY_DN12047_c0_g1~~TRINITY_DN12047_c0_g1_i1.p1  ORF type:complete len:260 (+),score=33.89 TRINITY_DN12047_c0_g1_i1:42-821(+)